jgi:hypothetical protein
MSIFPIYVTDFDCNRKVFQDSAAARIFVVREVDKIDREVTKDFVPTGSPP